MKKIFNWTFFMSLTLLCASALAYTIHYFIFKDAHHIFIYLVGDLGFLFLDVLLVILLLEKLLAHRDKKALMSKLNIVIGTFFSDVGLGLLKRINVFVENWQKLEKECEISLEWDKKDFTRAMAAAHKFPFSINIRIDNLLELREFLIAKRPCMLRMLENPNLFEHDQFTDLLWAVFHISEELSFRGDELDNLPETDTNHIAGDLRRAYSQLTVLWLQYTLHLKKNYPFLFSLAARVNPMNPAASPVVK
ncbi:MAG: hypothetical protein MUP98_12145 [Candidatus Aminicenantes bacterium]|nr:hypothetical protein [Candidatus Aminicenantes bacterium]